MRHLIVASCGTKLISLREHSRNFSQAKWRWMMCGERLTDGAVPFTGVARCVCTQLTSASDYHEAQQAFEAALALVGGANAL
jgi:hypothetical protein